MYSKSGKLFYIGDINTGTEFGESEVFVDNTSVRTYSSVGELKYDPIKDQMNFFASRNNKIYSVAIKF